MKSIKGIALLFMITFMVLMNSVQVFGADSCGELPAEVQALPMFTESVYTTNAHAPTPFGMIKVIHRLEGKQDVAAFIPVGYRPDCTCIDKESKLRPGPMPPPGQPWFCYDC